MSKKYGFTPLSIILSNKLLLYRVIFESGEKVVAGNYWGSPIRIIFLGAYWIGIKLFGSVHYIYFYKKMIKINLN